MSDYETGLSMHPRMIVRGLAEAKLEPVMVGPRGRDLTEAVVRQRDALKVFGQSTNPTVIADE